MTLRVVDPFKQQRMTVITSDERHYQSSTFHYNQRGVFLAFALNVGQQPRIRRGQEPSEAGAQGAGF